MDFALNLCRNFNLNPFEVLKQDTDYVISLINYYNEKGDEGDSSATDTKTQSKNNNERIRVNDKTATGGWF